MLDRGSLHVKVVVVRRVDNPRLMVATALMIIRREGMVRVEQLELPQPPSESKDSAGPVLQAHWHRSGEGTRTFRVQFDRPRPCEAEPVAESLEPARNQPVE